MRYTRVRTGQDQDRPVAVDQSLTAPGPRCHLPCMPERLVGVSQKDLQAPISVLSHGDITSSAQIGRRVKRDQIAPTPPTGHLRDTPEADVRNPGRSGRQKDLKPSINSVSRVK